MTDKKEQLKKEVDKLNSSLRRVSTPNELYDAFIKSQSNEEELNKIKQDILENKKSIKEVRIEISDQKKDSSLHQSSSE